MIFSIFENIEDAIPNSIHNKSGCYALLYFDNKFPRKIQRLSGTDIQGILYIGKADVLINRVKSLQKSVLNNSDHTQTKPRIKGHQSLSKKFFRIRKKINTSALHIKIYNNYVDDPEQVESFLLETYVSKYGELPPLNGQYGKYEMNDINLIKKIKL